MSSEFRVTIPGQPPSANKQYERRAGGLQLARRSGVTTYADLVTMLVREAKPGRFYPIGQVRLVFDFYLGRSVDADNMLKILDDAIADGLGVDDHIFLPCVRTLTTKNPTKNIRTEVEVQWQQALRPLSE
jgi:Holliday junction resolvase RusA-like endonuclease